jgi:CheY-like chemotaxis protein
VVGEEAARLRAGPAAGLDLQVQHAPDLPPVGLDPDPLRQVLAALLDNACEAAAPAAAAGGPARVTVTARAAVLGPAECRDVYGEVRPGPHVEVLVADTGPGLTAEARQRLFTDPFFSTRSRRRGFGLATAYGILCAHRGGLDLRPNPDLGDGRGLEARVLLPAAAPPDAVPGVVAPSATAAAAAAGLRGERVLVVDDDPGILQFVGRTLERAGYRVQAAATAAAALEAHAAAGDDRFRLVLADVIMPDVGGVELAHRLLNRDPGVRVVFMTGQVSVDFVQRNFHGPAFEVLHKPFRPEGLLRAVRAALDRGGRGKAAGKQTKPASSQ